MRLLFVSWINKVVSLKRKLFTTQPTLPLSRRGYTLNSKHFSPPKSTSLCPWILAEKGFPVDRFARPTAREATISKLSRATVFINLASLLRKMEKGIDLRELSGLFDQWIDRWFNREYPDGGWDRAKLCVRHARATTNFRNQARDHVRSTPEGRHSVHFRPVRSTQSSARPRQRIPEIAARKSVAMPRGYHQFECLSLKRADRRSSVPRSRKLSGKRLPGCFSVVWGKRFVLRSTIQLFGIFSTKNLFHKFVIKSRVDILIIFFDCLLRSTRFGKKICHRNNDKKLKLKWILLISI